MYVPCFLQCEGGMRTVLFTVYRWDTYNAVYSVKVGYVGGVCNMLFTV